MANNDILIGWKSNKNKNILWQKAKNNKDALNKLSKIKSNKNDLVVLRFDTINLDFVKSAYKIIGNKLRIAPRYSQQHKYVVTNNLDYYPYYTYDEIISKEKKFNIYSRSLKDYPSKSGKIKHLSPLEKFIAAYLITIKFAKYKHVDDKYKEYHASRSAYEFIDKKEDIRIVCVGFVHLIEELLRRTHTWKKSDIVSYTVTDGSKDEDGITICHMRLLVWLKDPKYGIDGLYLSDPTFDASNGDIIKIMHMLMSSDEVNENDKKDGFKNYNITDFAKGKIKNIMKIPDVDEYHKRPISHDAIIKAFINVDHFFDKDKEMIEDDNYDPIEYYDTAYKIGLYKEAEKCLYDAFITLKPSEIIKHHLFKHILTFFANLTEKIEKTCSKYIEPLLFYDDKEKTINMCFYANNAPIDEIEELNKKYEIRNNWKDEWTFFDIGKLDERPVVEQIDDIVKCFEEADNYYGEIKERKEKGNSK